MAARRTPAEDAEFAELESFEVPPLGGGAPGYVRRGRIPQNGQQPTRDPLKPGLRTASERKAGTWPFPRIRPWGQTLVRISLQSGQRL